MWYPDEFMTYFPKVVLDFVALIRYFEAWLAMLTIVLWHLYFVIVDPEIYPMNWSWLTGHITMRTFRREHRREFDREHAEKKSGGASG